MFLKKNILVGGVYVAMALAGFGTCAFLRISLSLGHSSWWAFKSSLVRVLLRFLCKRIGKCWEGLIYPLKINQLINCNHLRGLSVTDQREGLFVCLQQTKKAGLKVCQHVYLSPTITEGHLSVCNHARSLPVDLSVTIWEAGLIICTWPRSLAICICL